MIELVKIKNVALISSLELNLSGGFNVLMGETGAGKSIIIDSISFVLGSKADKTLIRNQENEMKVTLKATSNSKQLQAVLEENGIEVDMYTNEHNTPQFDVIMNRTLNMLGKSDCRINGEVVSVSFMKQVGEYLIDIYAQNESIYLLKPKNHLGILDSYKPNLLLKVKTDIADIIDKLKFIDKEISSFGGDVSARQKEIDFLRYQVKEIEEASLKIDEDNELDETLTKLNHSERITDALKTLNSYFMVENGHNLLMYALRELQNVENFDGDISELVSRLNSIKLDLSDIEDTSYNILENYNFDENYLDRLMQRKDEIQLLKKKYGNSIENVIKFKNSAQERLETLENCEELLNKKLKEKAILINKLYSSYCSLSEKRKSMSNEIKLKLEEELKTLELKNSRFEVKFNETPSIDDIEYCINGFDDVEFMFSANTGEELKPLAKTISGGEMSRFMLAFKNVVTNEDINKTLIFDEIDSGISGNTAISVANKLKFLSKTYQVLCITHLPVVASSATSFFYVSKSFENGRTVATVDCLENNEIIEKIAIMASGKLDESSYSYAKTLIESNKN